MAWRRRLEVEIGLLFTGAERGIGTNGKGQIVRQESRVSVRSSNGGCVSSAERRTHGCSTCPEEHVCNGGECRRLN